jgi:hypothetical protein
MKSFTKIIFLLSICLLLITCMGKKQSNAKMSNAYVLVHQDSSRVPRAMGDSVISFDMKQDLSNKSLQELRLIKSSVYARHGYCFMEADLRSYFTAHTTWYDTLMSNRYDTNFDKALNAWVVLSEEEKEFVKKVTTLENEKLKNNYTGDSNRNLANVDNIVNFFQYKNLSKGFIQKVSQNGFAIVPGTEIQLFHTYEANDYKELPNFVTTDLYLQLLHMYFSYLMRSLEKAYLIPAATKLSDGIYKECTSIASASSNKELKAIAEYSAVYAAIPSHILTSEKKKIPASYTADFNNEIKNIDACEDAFSEYLDYTRVYFPYSLFKPRGNYTRTEELRKYFKAMIWLQVVPFCRDNEKQLTRAIFLASVLNKGKTSDGTSLLEVYHSLYEPISFIIGEPDNLSILDIAEFLKKEHIESPTKAVDKMNIAKVNKYLLKIKGSKNKIKPKIQISCEDKINLIPQRYLMDNEMLQELVDVKINAERAYPKGLDVFASFGNPLAEDILMNTYKEGNNWKDYSTNLKKLQKKFAGYQDWDKAVYNKWIECLLASTLKNTDYPSFMQTSEWGKKNLNTALASWAELKHDAILYAEQPAAAECGAGGPPPPIVVGYVEPNVKFWTKILELLSLTEDMLKRNQFLKDDIASKTKSLREQAEFLLAASKKELNHEKLTEQEYNTIETIGASTEYLTLSIIDPVPQNWENVMGPDKSIAVVADIYTRNVLDCPKDGILHVATGKANEIYVVVEIEGYLYLTKGATFSYFEFVRPINNRLTDEEWQKILEGKETPAIPVWMKDILYEDPAKPKVDEKVFYSSGC